MLRKLFLTSVTCLSVMLQAQNVIVLKGCVDNPDNASKMLVYRMDKMQKIDVLTFDLDANNCFDEKIKVDVPGVYYLDCQKKQRLAFWAEDENVEVRFFGKDTAKVKQKRMPELINPGIKNKVFSLYSYGNFMFGNQQMDFMAEKVKAEKSGCKEWIEVTKSHSAKSTKDFVEYATLLVDTYPEVSSTIGILPMIAKGDEVNFQKSLDKVTAYHKGNPVFENYMKILREKQGLSQLKQAAPAFKLSTPTGTEFIAPSDFKGKLLLIDFWASWCGPCRKSIPLLKELYGKYNSQGFDILSVSIDKNPEAWLKSLDEEKMPWEQVISSDGGKDVMGLYKFMIVPTLVLVDRDGNIIKKGIRVADLEGLIKANIEKTK